MTGIERTVNTVLGVTIMAAVLSNPTALTIIIVGTAVNCAVSKKEAK